MTPQLTFVCRQDDACALNQLTLRPREAMRCGERHRRCRDGLLCQEGEHYPLVALRALCTHWPPSPDACAGLETLRCQGGLHPDKSGGPAGHYIQEAGQHELPCQHHADEATRTGRTEGIERMISDWADNFKPSPCTTHRRRAYFYRWMQFSDHRSPLGDVRVEKNKK